MIYRNSILYSLIIIIFFLFVFIESLNSISLSRGLPSDMPENDPATFITPTPEDTSVTIITPVPGEGVIEITEETPIPDITDLTGVTPVPSEVDGNKTPPPAEVSAGSPTPSEAGGEEKTRVQISSDHLSGDDNTKIFKLWGNVTITQEDSVLKSDEATFNTKTKVAVATSNVVFTRPGSRITGDKVTVYYEEKRGYWESNVYIRIDKLEQKEGEPKELEDGPVDMYSDTLEFFWEKPRKAIAIGNVEVHQKDKHAFGDKATYTEKPQTIFVESNVRLERDDGSWMTCDFLTLHVKEETVEAEGNVKGSMFVDEGEIK